MTEINKLENKIKNFREGFDYLVSDNGRGEKTYTIRSEETKQSLRDILHSTREWRIEYVAGQEGTEFTIEQDNNFGLYWKSFDVDSPDEFVVLDVSNSLRDILSSNERKREVFIQSARKIKESEQRIKESEQRIKFLQIGQSVINPESKNNVSFSIGKNEKGEWEKGMNTEQCPNQTIKDLLSKWENEGLFQNKDGEISQQTSSWQNIIGSQQKDNSQQQNFTPHHQIPPKK